MNSNAYQRYVPLAVWVVAVSALLYIPFKIISAGFLPGDDAMRHAAKAVSGKSWPDILVMREDFQIDPSPGWQTILSWVHSLSGGNAESLVIFSSVGLMLLVTLSVLPWLRRPEAWLGALLVAVIFTPECATRLMRGRPYILTDFCLLMILFLWSRQEKDSPTRLALIFTPLLVAASAWIHGSWYMLALPGMAILLTGFWRSAAAYGVCWIGGSLLGCGLTGHPVGFLWQSVRHMFGVFGNTVLPRQLAPELRGSEGAPLAIIVVALLLLWRVQSLGWNRKVIFNPFFMMMAMGCLLGFKVQRFWWDWGMMAFMVWVALELQAHFTRHVPADSAKRLVAVLVLGAGLVFGFTNDRENRWSAALMNDYLTPEKPDLVGWLPETGGIIYNSDMDVFFDTFYKNPTAPWRYVLGFEAGLMTPENLAVLRKAQWNLGDSRAYEPWVKKMRPADRMIIHARNGGQPNLPELEWYYAATEIWIGRLPQLQPNSGSAAPK